MVGQELRRRGKRSSPVRRTRIGAGSLRLPHRIDITEERSLASLVMLAGRLFSRALHSRLVPHGVAPGQLAVLQRLWEADGLTQAALARAAHVEQPTMARTLDRMARDSLIERVPSRDDRRAFNVRLTRRGRQLRHAVAAEAAALDKDVVSTLPKAERKRLEELLRHLLENLRRDGRNEE
jgi:DNA-binding MarR family transcriptional regulator